MDYLLNYFQERFSEETVKELLNAGSAVDASKGGLILGRSHDEGGIYMLIKKLGDDYYSLEGEVEGYEYVLNPGASAYFSNSFHQLNKPDEHYSPSFEPYIPSEEIDIIDTRNEYQPKYMIFEIGGFAIVNRHSTKGLLNSLDKMNKAVSYKMVSQELMDFVHLNRDEIAVNFYETRIGFFPER